MKNTPAVHQEGQVLQLLQQLQQSMQQTQQEQGQIRRDMQQIQRGQEQFQRGQEHNLEQIQRGQEQIKRDIQQIEQDMERCNQNSISRILNSVVTNADTLLESLHGIDNEIIPNFPRTARAVGRLTGPEINGLLASLGLDVNGLVLCPGVSIWVNALGLPVNRAAVNPEIHTLVNASAMNWQVEIRRACFMREIGLVSTIF